MIIMIKLSHIVQPCGKQSVLHPKAKSASRSHKAVPCMRRLETAVCHLTDVSIVPPTLIVRRELAKPAKSRWDLVMGRQGFAAWL